MNVSFFMDTLFRIIPTSLCRWETAPGEISHVQRFWNVLDVHSLPYTHCENDVAFCVCETLMGEEFVSLP